MKLSLIFLLISNSFCNDENIAEETGSHGHGGHEIEYVMVFIIYGLIISILLSTLKNVTKIPYTPMLLVVGMAIGALSPWLWVFGTSMQYVINLSGHVLLFIFIPPLIFESAFSFDVPIFLNSIFQILILAFPVVALQVFLCAVILLYILRYNSILDWPECLVIGSILSATDPVAVVALLKELGTPINFNILLEGESLLNDGTGTVFFAVFYSWIELGKFSVGEFFHKFFRLALGGPLFGILVAFISYPLLKQIIQHETLFVLSTVLVTYFTFYMAESSYFQIHVSGILALVALGIYYS